MKLYLYFLDSGITSRWAAQEGQLPEYSLDSQAPVPHFADLPPLLHFLWFLLKAVRLAAVSPSAQRVFTSLRSAYSTAISSDPDYLQVLADFLFCHSFSIWTQ